MATLDLSKPELTLQESEEIRNEVARFEKLCQERYSAPTPLQKANLTHAYRIAVEAGIGLECPADALMAWGVHTGLLFDTLEDRHAIECLLLDYDGDHEDLDGYIREIYSRYFHVDDAKALLFIDTVAFKDELECRGYCFAPSLDGSVYHVFND